MRILGRTWHTDRLPLIVLVSVMLCQFTQAQVGPANGPLTPLELPRGSYRIDCAVEIDSSQVRVNGVETITLANNSTLPIEWLTLNWTLDSSRTLSLTVDGHAVEVVSPGAESDPPDPLTIRLNHAVSPGENAVIRAEFGRTYEMDPGDDKPLLTQWYPRLDWGLQKQDDFVVSVTNNSDYVLVTSGRHDPETDTYRATGVREFGLYFLKGGEVLKGSSEGIEVQVVHSPAGTECANLVMETALDAIAFYKKRFGFYPAEHLNIVQGADAPNGGYPAATNLVVVHGLERMSERDELHWRWITAHEIGHQYWFEHVMSEWRDEIGWLMIGLGIFVDREYVRSKGLAPGRHIGLMRRFIDGAREGLDTRADVHSDYLRDIDFDFNNVVIHGKGYSIISALNCLLGDEVFERIHSRCLTEFAGTRLSGYQFQEVCETESGQNLGWFFDQWVRSSRFPSYEIKSDECTGTNDGFSSEVVVERTGTLDMPVPVTAYFADGTTQTNFTTRLQPVCTLRFESVAALDSAVIDPNHEIALVVPPPSAEEIRIRKVLSSLPSRAAFDSLGEVVSRALKLNIQQTLFWGRLGRQLYDWSLYDEALDVFERRLELLKEANSEWVASVYGWQGLLLDLLGRRSEALAAYERALAVETDREFSYAGDPVTISREWLEERLKTPYTRVSEN